MNAALPKLVRGHVERCVPEGPVPAWLRLAQDGRMSQKPGGRALRFTAMHTVAAERVSFSWRARFPIVGPLALRVVDEYADGDGKLEVRLLGIPVQRQGGRETVLGEALRYLAELPWVPHALAHNRELEWRELGERACEVATRVLGERLAVAVEFDEAGDIVRTSSQQRLRPVGDAWVATPWGGDFGDYRGFGGIRVPASGEAWWELPEGRFVYWRGTVTSVEPGAAHDRS